MVLFAATVFLAGRIRRWESAPTASQGNTSRGRWNWALGAVALLVFAQMIALTAAEPGGLSNLSRRVLDASFTSYDTVAREVQDPLDFLRNYHRWQSRFPVHGPSQPPGRVLFFWLSNRFAHGPPEAEARHSALLLMLAGSWCVFPLAVIAGGRARPGAVAAAVLLFACVPSILLFTPQTDHLILLLTLSFAALIIASLRREGLHAILLAAAGGFCAGAAMFVSLTSIVAVGAWGLAIALGVGREPAGHARRIAAAAFAGFVAALAIPAALGMNWLEVFRECMAGAHRIQVLILGRQYSTWVAWNLVDYALFLGPALTMAAAAVAFDEARGLRSKNEVAALLFENRASFPFALAMFVILLALDLSGKILGETGRIWMFLMPLAVLGVAAPGRFAQRHLVSLAIAQFLFLLTLRMTWNVPG
ncbi:MAG TPA: hypothetical protein VFR10_10905 [bacterium]|nr:hypothetical protein [bacterium]